MGEKLYCREKLVGGEFLHRELPGTRWEAMRKRMANPIVSDPTIVDEVSKDLDLYDFWKTSTLRSWSYCDLAEGADPDNKNIVSLSGVILDFDNIADEAREDIFAELTGAGIEAGYHTSPSYRLPCKEMPVSFRVIIPLRKPIQMQDWERAINAVGRIMPTAVRMMDPRCKEPSRQYIIPAHLAGKPYEHRFWSGNLLDLHSRIERDPLKEEWMAKEEARRRAAIKATAAILTSGRDMAGTASRTIQRKLETEFFEGARNTAVTSTLAYAAHMAQEHLLDYDQMADMVVDFVEANDPRFLVEAKGIAKGTKRKYGV
jgi:hypothetical protein